MTFAMRVFCVAVVVGFIWIFGEPAIFAFKAWWRKRTWQEIEPIETRPCCYLGQRCPICEPQEERCDCPICMEDSEWRPAS